MSDSVQDLAKPSAIGLFDLDGTLLPWDCQLLFRHFVTQKEPWRRCLLPVFLALAPLTPILGSGGMKRVFLSFLWRMDRPTLESYATEFAQLLIGQVYQELSEEIADHRRQGHFLILASASPSWYVVPLGKALGFDLSLGTEVETPPLMPLFPDLENHKGAEKVARLQRLLPESWFINETLVPCHGYTDSTADLPMLTLCDRVTLVNPSPALSALGEKNHWQSVTPARPWSGKWDRYRRMLALLLGVGTDPGTIR